MIKLEPAAYVCPTHEEDLTGLVVAVLSGGTSVVTTFGATTGKEPKSDARRSFLVVVPCPKGPHDVECSGTFNSG